MEESAIYLFLEIFFCSIITLFLLLYYSMKNTNKLVFFTAYITWLMNFVLVILLPFDIYYTQTKKGKENGMKNITENILKYGYGITYWSLFILSWIFIPLLQSYESSGEFTKMEKLKSSLRENVIFYCILGVICIIILFISFLTKGFDYTLILAKDFSLFFGILVFFFLLAYSLTKYPKTLYENLNLKRLVKYYEWRVNQFFEKLEEIKYDLISKFVRLRITINNLNGKDDHESKSNKNSINTNKSNDKNNNSSLQSDLSKTRQVKDYLTYMEKKYNDFEKISSQFGISLSKEKEDDLKPIIKVEDLIELNRKINKKINDHLRLQCRIRDCYSNWAILNTVLFMNENDKIEIKDKKIKKNNNKKIEENNKNENLIVENEKILSLEEEGFIPLENFSKFKLFYYTRIKIFLTYVLFSLCIIAGLFILFGEILLLFDTNLLYKILSKINNIVLIHFVILIPLLFLICMSNYTLFKVKISSYIYMYGHRQTNSVSLMIFSSYLSRIYFAICLNFVQTLNRFKSDEKSKFEIFFGIKQDESETNFMIRYCRFSPIFLFICIILFILNIPGKIGASVGCNLFEFESEERNLGIKDGHKYLMNLNKKLNGKKLNNNDPMIFKDR